SARQYKKTTKTIPQIGRDLGVDYVLEGSVRWDKPPRGPSRVRVTPQLIRVSDASHVWAHVYDAVLADVFAVQSNIARQVAETLEVTLLAPERQALDAKPTTNLEAYDYYLRGKDYQARQLDDEDAHLAVRMYPRAVQLEPTFVLAYGALTRAHLNLSWGFGETGELPKAQAALDRAQQLGPELVETHLALGYHYYYGSRDYDHALEQFAWVRARQPNDPDAIRMIGAIHRRAPQEVIPPATTWPKPSTTTSPARPHGRMPTSTRPASSWKRRWPPDRRTRHQSSGPWKCLSGWPTPAWVAGPTRFDSGDKEPSSSQYREMRSPGLSCCSDWPRSIYSRGSTRPRSTNSST